MLSTILIIDKRKELSTKYKKSIENPSINAIITRSLQEALIFVQAQEPDMIIVSDSIEEALPDFCQKIRALTYNTRPIIIALSKSADFNDRISTLEAGADDFISEPVNIEEFKTRIKAHLRRDIESNLDNKTLLPNRKYVKKSLKRILNSNNHAVLNVNIQNLQEYKSVYTELASDKLLQTFVAIAKSALSEDDFIGQIDETNFVIITNKYGVEKLAEYLVFAFDTVAPKFYSETDVKRGYMTLKGESYTGMRVEFVSILIGGITENLNKIGSTDFILDKLRNLTQIAKIPNGSNFIIERTQLTANDSIVESFSNRNIYIQEKDESLKYLIRTSLELQGYDIQDILDFESALQPSIAIIDISNDLKELENLKKIKQMHNFANTKFIVTTTIHEKSTILDAGGDLYLPKPYEILDLIKWVEYFLKK